MFILTYAYIRFFIPEGSGVFGIKIKPEYRFVWNKYLLEAFEKQVHHDWVLYVVYGFIAQSSILFIMALSIVNCCVRLFEFGKVKNCNQYGTCTTVG